MIFDESTLRKLNTLTLVATQVRAGAIKGERRSTKRGSSVEFADYRDYVPGDDLRRLDWNIYARLDRPFIKLLEEEEDLAVHLLVDASLSMDWGADETNKFRYALRLVAALGAVALTSGDRLTVKLLRVGKGDLSFGPARGQHRLMDLLNFLELQKADGVTDLNRALKAFGLTAKRAGLVILISDLLSPGGYQDGLAQLQARGHEVAVVHLLAPEELEPPLAGDLRLVDVETGAWQEVSLDGGIRRRYQVRLRAWQEEIQAYSRRRGIRYLNPSTSTPWDKFVLREMRRARVVK